jgi:hypothetical protein
MSQGKRGDQSAGADLSTTAYPPPSRPAFANPRHLTLWIVALVAILVAPVLADYLVPTEARYRMMSKRLGPTDWHAEQIFADTTELDILFLGSSRMLAGFDHVVLDAALSTDGGPPKTATIATDYANSDLNFLILTDFFARRKAKLVVLSFPEPPQAFSHPGAKYIRRFDLRDPAISMRTPSVAISNFAEAALISPRLLVAALIPPKPIKAAEDTQLSLNHGTRMMDVGFKNKPGEPDVPFVAPDAYPEEPKAELIEAGSPLPKWISTFEEHLSNIEAAYLPAIRSLCEKHGAKLAFVRFPMADLSERSGIKISREGLNAGLPLIAADLDMLFGDKMSLNAIKRFYRDKAHFNRVGTGVAARGFAPALKELWRASDRP